jgi:hypothetical protein
MTTKHIVPCRILSCITLQTQEQDDDEDEEVKDLQVKVNQIPPSFCNSFSQLILISLLDDKRNKNKV